MDINKVEKLYFNSSFTSYKITLVNGNKLIVPLDTANTDYQVIQQWIADGGTVIDNGE